MKSARNIKPTQVDPGRRNLIVAIGAVAVLAAGAGGYFLWQRPTPGRGRATQASATVSMNELLEPGPLPDHALGRPDAPVTIVEYASMTCTHCADFHSRTYPTLKSRYIEPGKVRYILREFPLDALGTGAFMLARCAGNERFFDLVEVLFQQQRQWATNQNPLDALFAVAKQAGFSEQSFKACLGDQKMMEGLEQVRTRAADKFGVNSTPTFFINGTRRVGAISVEELDKLVQPYLKS